MEGVRVWETMSERACGDALIPLEVAGLGVCSGKGCGV